MKRITMAQGKKKRTLVLVAPPYPEVGDAIRLKGGEWECRKVVEVRGPVIELKFPAKAARESVA